METDAVGQAEAIIPLQVVSESSGEYFLRDSAGG